MTDLDQNETRVLAKTLARQLGPHLEGDALDAVAGNLMRLAARMTGHVAADAVGSGMAYCPAEEEAYVRFLAVKEGMETLAGQAHDTGELLAEGDRCQGCGEYGDNAACISNRKQFPCVECGWYGQHRMDCGTGRRSR